MRSLQSPSGGDAPLRAENAMLRGELGRLQAAGGPGGAAPASAAPPATLEEFLALPAPQRQAAARQMTQQQRDDLLGRSAGRPDAECYL